MMSATKKVKISHPRASDGGGSISSFFPKMTTASVAVTEIEHAPPRDSTPGSEGAELQSPAEFNAASPSPISRQIVPEDQDQERGGNEDKNSEKMAEISRLAGPNQTPTKYEKRLISGQHRGFSAAWFKVCISPQQHNIRSNIALFHML